LPFHALKQICSNFTEVRNKKDMETEIERFGNNIHK